MRFAERLAAAWYAPRLDVRTLPFAPLAFVFAAGVALRRWCYRSSWLAARRVGVPVIVVGNITVGGSGKTPLVAALARELEARGWRPGIVSRGYGGSDLAAAPRVVPVDGDPAAFGDEPVLLARRGLRVVVARDRVAAARALLARFPDCNVIVADDGLQHYRLARDFEIAVVDAVRRFGNGWPLPAGPLREPPSRLASVDAVVVTQVDAGAFDGLGHGALAMTLVAGLPTRVAGAKETTPLTTFAGQRLHAVAGIGDPSRFFAQLRALSVDAIEHPFPDHHRFSAADLAFPAAEPILMTEKDAVKCVAFADRRCWYLPIEARLDPALIPRIEEKLRGSQAA
jgi:tetraacyldisaccharide 4'-kinase